jgi:hypothetical protein
MVRSIFEISACKLEQTESDGHKCFKLNQAAYGSGDAQFRRFEWTESSLHSSN